MFIIYKFDKSDGSESRGEVSDERVVMTRKFCRTLVNLEVTRFMCLFCLGLSRTTRVDLGGVVSTQEVTAREFHSFYLFIEDDKVSSSLNDSY